jgi:hypothetical protein
MFLTKSINSTIMVLILIVSFIGLIHYTHPFFIEPFKSDTSHSVDLPINNPVSCKNMCGPLARCSISGEQCTSDVDCYGCQSLSRNKQWYGPVRGQNDAGKLTVGVTPQYSSLTTDIGTQSLLYNKNAKPIPETSYQGTDLWRKTFDYGLMLYDKRNNPNIESEPYLPKYPKRTTLSGGFIDDGPLASNDYLT